MYDNDPRKFAQEAAIAHAVEMYGHLYRHFKGGIYKVLGVGVHSETAEPMVIYSSEHGSQIWLRPLSMFLSQVDHDKYPDVQQKYRFQRLD